jgi:hypothetical protein
LEQADVAFATIGGAPLYGLAALAAEDPPDKNSAADGLTGAGVEGSPASAMLLRKSLPEARPEGGEWDGRAMARAVDGGD